MDIIHRPVFYLLTRRFGDWIPSTESRVLNKRQDDGYIQNCDISDVIELVFRHVPGGTEENQNKVDVSPLCGRNLMESIPNINRFAVEKSC
jgi:hypothetical protein